MEISKSKCRHTFQRDSYINRVVEAGMRLDDPEVKAMIDVFDEWIQRSSEEVNKVEWQQNNMEYDLRTSEEMLSKVRNSDTYAQNLYAALCNNEFQELDMWPILKDQRWSCSWRSAGGIVANMKANGDYIDWYCSGIGDGLGNGDSTGIKKYVAESCVTNEIANDLRTLGWVVLGHNPNDEEIE